GHASGGFVNRPSRALYRRWLGCGLLTSHTRTHGAPPREPWEWDAGIVADFQRALALRYSLMPYIYAQSVAASERGHPVLRTLFFEFPDDPTSWTVDDEYMFGADMLVAPLIEVGDSRSVYLPPGEWIDYQTGRSHAGGGWHELTAGPIPVILLVRGGAVIPHVAPAQNTEQLNWNEVELRAYGEVEEGATVLFALPGEPLRQLRLDGMGGIVQDPFAG